MQVDNSGQTIWSSEHPTPEPERSNELELMAMFARPKTSEVHRHQLQTLFNKALLWLLCSQALSIVVVILCWPRVQQGALLAWLCSASLVTLAQSLLVHRYRQVQDRPHSVSNWHALFFLGAAAIGGHWGFFVASLPQTPIESLLLISALAALLILVSGLLRYSFRSFAVFVLTSVLPPLALMIRSGEPPLIWLPALLLPTALLTSAWRESRKAQRELFQRLEHRSLVDYLDNARLVAENLNQQLSHEVSRRQSVERALQQTQRELEWKIQERTRELSEANELLNQQIKLRKSISDALVKSQTRLSQAIEASHLALWDWDLTTGQVYQSHFNSVFGPREISSEEFMDNMRKRIHPDDFQRTRDELASYLRGERERYIVQYRVNTGAGDWMWVEDAGKAVRTEKSGRICRMLGTRRDISLEKQRDEELRMVKSVFDNTSEGVFVLDTEFRFVSINRAFTRITGYQADEVLGKGIVDLSNTQRKEEVFEQAQAALQQSGVFKAELLERRKNGEYFPEWLQVNVIRNSAGELTHYAGLFSDLTERKQAAERLQYLLNYDDLTGLANRVLFRDRLHDALNQARAGKCTFALMCINIDRFKQINESLGHDSGDELLRQVAHRLTASLPEADTVARMGNDEFAILLQADNRSRAGAMADRILDALRAPLFIEAHEILMTVSLGITMLPDSARELQPALQQSNTAMRQAKYLGGNTFEFYSSALHAASRQRLRLETELRKALQADALEVFYQPKQRLSSGQIDSVEALVRWRHPERGLVSPNEFVPIAEESGLIAEIGERVLQIACRQAQQWRQEGLGNIKMAVNLSAHQVRQSGLMYSIRSVLKTSGLDPRLLDLELTESALMENISRSLSLMGKLRAMGINVTIDDFGTGYSSLSYLKQFPIDAIKIDKFFIKDVARNAEDAAITQAIILLGQNLKMEVIAEGVETQEQLDFLKAHGCDVVQGYYLSRPLSAERMTARLRTQCSTAVKRCPVGVVKTER